MGSGLDSRSCGGTLGVPLPSPHTVQHGTMVLLESSRVGTKVFPLGVSALILLPGADPGKKKIKHLVLICILIALWCVCVCVCVCACVYDVGVCRHLPQVGTEMSLVKLLLH